MMDGMRRELLEELLTAAQEVVNSRAGLLGSYVKLDLVPYHHLRRAVQAISDEGVAFAVRYAQETRGEPVNWAQIEAAVGHPFSVEEREALAPTKR